MMTVGLLPLAVAGIRAVVPHSPSKLPQHLSIISARSKYKMEKKEKRKEKKEIRDHRDHFLPSLGL